MKPLVQRKFWRQHSSPQPDPEILASWRRSRDAKVLSERPSLQRPDNQRLMAHRKRRNKLIRTADIYLRQFPDLLQCRRYSIALVDEDGIVLLLYCDSTTRRIPLFFEGADWSEHKIGTNGAGTALATQQPVVISGTQHYCRQFHEWTCIAAPIKIAPDKIIGALNISVPNNLAQPFIVGMVLHAANSIAVSCNTESTAQLLTASMAHETRNPLTVASGFVQMIALADLPEKYKNYAILALDNIEKANDILSNFTSLLKSRLDPDMEAVNIYQSIQEVVENLHCMASRRSISITLQAKNKSAAVRTDPLLLRCVWINLLKNAIEAMESGSIHVSILVKQRRAIICIQDQGPGIPPEVLKHLFKPFNTQKASGTGLGLAICREILTTFRGSIRITCPQRGGTIVRICLPVSEKGS